MAKSPNSIDVHVGARIRMRRAVMAMSQEKLGEKLGITFQQIQKYEKGANRVGASRLQAIAHALSVPISYFFDGEAGTASLDGVGSPYVDPLAQFITSSEGIAVSRAFMNIEEADVRRAVLNLMKSLGKAQFDDSRASTGGESIGPAHN